MQAKNIIRTALLAASALLVAACVFPFQPDIKKGAEYPLVVEGDIHPGVATTIYFAYVEPFDKEEYEIPSVYVKGYIEGEHGNKVNGVFISREDAVAASEASGGSSLSKKRSSLSFDTAELPGNQKYRLHFETLDGPGGAVLNTFETDWLDVTPAPVIDALTYNKNDKFKELQIGLSMHCGGSHHFRWSFSETWQYHSDINTYLYYDPAANEVKAFAQGEPTLYYCWSTSESSTINLFDTSDQKDDRFEDLAFYSIPLSGLRLQVMYKIEVRLEAITDAAYEYWYGLNQNSEGQGGLFSPIPSSLASNISCLSDPTQQVIGYICVSEQAVKVLYYNNRKENYYAGHGFNYDPDLHESGTNEDEYVFYYNRGYLPSEEIFNDLGAVIGYKWVKGRCVDCRKASAGHKTKPDDWPNDDK